MIEPQETKKQAAPVLATGSAWPGDEEIEIDEPEMNEEEGAVEYGIEDRKEGEQELEEVASDIFVPPS